MGGSRLSIFTSSWMARSNPLPSRGSASSSRDIASAVGNSHSQPRRSSPQRTDPATGHRRHRTAASLASVVLQHRGVESITFLSRTDAANPPWCAPFLKIKRDFLTLAGEGVVATVQARPDFSIERRKSFGIKELERLMAVLRVIHGRTCQFAWESQEWTLPGSCSFGFLAFGAAPLRVRPVPFGGFSPTGLRHTGVILGWPSFK